MEPESWRWIWIVAAAVFAIGELSAPGSFFLLPFAIGAAVAAALAFADVPVIVEMLVFLGISLGSLFVLRRVAHRLDRDQPTHGIGSRRLIGQPAVTLEAIDRHQNLGLVRVGREEWPAESIDSEIIPVGANVKIVEVRGTRVVVHADPTVPPAAPPPAELE